MDSKALTCESCGKCIDAVTLVEVGGGFAWVYLCKECLDKMLGKKEEGLDNE